MKQWKECEKCGLNSYIEESGKLCPHCNSTNKPIPPKPIRELVRGSVYGSNARKIYERFCDEFDWDKWQASVFNRGGIFNAKDAAKHGM